MALWRNVYINLGSDRVQRKVAWLDYTFLFVLFFLNFKLFHND